MRDWLIASLLVLAIVVVYLPAIGGDFLWDDDAYVTENETLRSPGGLWQIWFRIGSTPQYYPLVFTTFWAEYRLWGLDPAGYHIVNVLLHAASAVLVWRIGRKLAIPGALAAGFVFGLHPVHVESVAWIAERKNVLSGLFYLAALLAFFRFEEHAARLRWYLFALLLFVAALLSKTVTATLPAALLLIEWWKTGRVSRRKVALVLPMLVLGALAGTLTAWVEKHHVGTKYLEWDLGLVERTLIAGRAVWFYVGNLLWPARLTFVYPRWQIEAHDAVQYVAPLAAVGLLALLWARRERWGRGPLAAALFFGGTLVPALGFVDVFPLRFSFVADHFQYLASLGPILLVCALGHLRLPRGLSRTAAGMAVAALLGALAYRQGSVYKDNESLWRDTLVKNPRATMARNNLGRVLEEQGKLDEAEQSYKDALADRDFEDRPEVLLNLANVATKRGELEEAVSYYREAIALRPSFSRALVNLGGILHNLGSLEEALVHLEHAVRANPEYALARNNLGSALIDAGRLEEAAVQLRAAIALDPEFAEPHYNLANALAKAQRWTEAEAEYQRAIEIRPEYVEAHFNLAGVLAVQGRSAEAAEHYRQAQRIRPP